MENGLERNETHLTLFSALNEWNNTENMFKEVFGEDSLKDRDFRKMKLREYDRIWYTFRDKPATTDEKALMVMLRFQRKKLRVILYNGLLSRLISRMGGYVRHLLSEPVPRMPKTASDAHRYSENFLHFKSKHFDGQQVAQKDFSQRRSNNVGNDLGRRRNRDQGNHNRNRL